jgi:non-ribosomal peptide synthetase component F
MEPIRAPFIVGLIGFVLGVVLLVAWWLINRPATVSLRFLHGLFFAAGLLLATTGGFLALCLGIVYLVYFLNQPRIAKAAK